MRSKKPKKYEQAVVRLDSLTLAALVKIEKTLGPGIVGVRSTAIRRAIINEAERISNA